MTELKELLESLGCGNVLTYLQSGNVIFRSSTEIGALASKLSDTFAGRFGFAVPIMLFSQDTLLEVHRENPFLSRSEIAADRLHVTLLEREPTATAVEELLEGCATPELAEWKGRALYLYCPDGYRNCSLQNGTVEKRLGLVATTRNWRTFSALADLVH